MSKNLKYKGKCIKMSDETWELFKKKRKESGKSWNLFILETITKNNGINNR